MSRARSRAGSNSGDNHGGGSGGGHDGGGDGGGGHDGEGDLHPPIARRQAGDGARVPGRAKFEAGGSPALDPRPCRAVSAPPRELNPSRPARPY
jgi:hypothetical protein